MAKTEKFIQTLETSEEFRLSMEAKAAEILHTLGVPANIKGYRYLREAILIATEHPASIYIMTKGIYPEVAKRFETTVIRSERAIRHAIEVAWDRGDLETLQKYFGYTVSNAKGKPKNSEFIAMVAEHLVLRMRQEDRKKESRPQSWDL